MSLFAVRFNNGSVSECNVSTFRGRACEHAERLDRRSHRHLVRGLSTSGPSYILEAINFASEVLQRVKVLRRVLLWTSVPCLSTSLPSIWDDGNSAYERLKRRQHRGVLLLSRTAVTFSVAGKVPGGVMTERWLGKRFHTEENIVARKGDGFVISEGDA